MRKIYEHIEYARVGHFQTILEEAGIPTLVKNLDASVGAGEIPFTEVFPELWVVEDADYDRALALLESYQPPAPGLLDDWVCQKCGEAVEKEFGECWNCGTLRPEYADQLDESGTESAE
jgi:rubrerythrin